MAESVRKQIEQLRRQIEHHNYLYYVEAAPEISDREFDRLTERLQQLEQRRLQNRHPAGDVPGRWDRLDLPSGMAVEV